MLMLSSVGRAHMDREATNGARHTRHRQRVCAHARTHEPQARAAAMHERLEMPVDETPGPGLYDANATAVRRTSAAHGWHESDGFEVDWQHPAVGQYEARALRVAPSAGTHMCHSCAPMWTCVHLLQGLASIQVSVPPMEPMSV